MASISTRYMKSKSCNYISIIFLIFHSSLEICAQTDVDVKVKDVPIEIRDYIIKTYPEAGKVRFFKETINETILYEAAFKTGRDKYQLIFLSNNKLGSTKRQIRFTELADTLRKLMLQDLKARYGSFALLKVKEINTLDEKIFELKVKLRLPDKRGFYEVFYSNTGNFILEQEEVLRSIPANTDF